MSCKSTELDALKLFNARGDNQMECNNLTKMIWPSTDVVECPSSLYVVIWWTSFSVILSVQGAPAFRGLMVRRPVCSTDVLECFHQPRRESSSSSRLPLAQVSLR